MNDINIFIRDRAQWDLRPDDYKNKPWFKVLVGSESIKSKILKKELYFLIIFILY